MPKPTTKPLQCPVLRDWRSGTILYASPTPCTLAEAIRAATEAHIHLDGADFRNTSLSAADLRHAVLPGAYFHGADLGDANLCDSVLCGATFAHANAQGAQFNRAKLAGANFYAACLRNADFCSAEFEHVGLGGANFDQADITEARFHPHDFAAANVVGSYVRRTNGTHDFVKAIATVRFDFARSRDGILTAVQFTRAIRLFGWPLARHPGYTPRIFRATLKRLSESEQRTYLAVLEAVLEQLRIAVRARQHSTGSV